MKSENLQIYVYINVVHLTILCNHTLSATHGMILLQIYSHIDYIATTTPVCNNYSYVPYLAKYFDELLNFAFDEKIG